MSKVTSVFANCVLFDFSSSLEQPWSHSKVYFNEFNMNLWTSWGAGFAFYRFVNGKLTQSQENKEKNKISLLSSVYVGCCRERSLTSQLGAGAGAHTHTYTLFLSGSLWSLWFSEKHVQTDSSWANKPADAHTNDQSPLLLTKRILDLRGEGGGVVSWVLFFLVQLTLSRVQRTQTERKT